MVLLLIFSGAIAYYGYLNLSTSIIIPFFGKEVSFALLSPFTLTPNVKGRFVALRIEKTLKNIQRYKKST